VKLATTPAKNGTSMTACQNKTEIVDTVLLVVGGGTAGLMAKTHGQENLHLMRKSPRIFAEFPSEATILPIIIYAGSGTYKMQTCKIWVSRHWQRHPRRAWHCRRGRQKDESRLGRQDRARNGCRDTHISQQGTHILQLIDAINANAKAETLSVGHG